jgi:formamidopyrimidine-DNA glycosylase
MWMRGDDLEGMAYLAESLSKELLRFGSDPLEADSRNLRNELRKKSTDQSVVAESARGARRGNIYADESLWGKIHPAKLGANLELKQVKLLYKSCRRFCRTRLCCGDHRYRTFLTRMASRENISGTIECMDEKDSRVFDAGRKYGG